MQYRSKVGPIPADHFENDPEYDDSIDRSPGSLYDRISRKLDERRLKKWLELKDQPRVPAGSPEGGQFTSDGGGGATSTRVKMGAGVTPEAVDTVKKAVDAIPEAHAKALADVPIKVVKSTDDLRGGSGNQVGMFRYMGDTPLGIEIAQTTNIQFGDSKHVVPVKNLEKVAIHEAGHALDHRNGWQLSRGLDTAIQTGVDRMTRREQQTGAYWIRDRSEAFAELYALAHNPNKDTGQVYFGKMPRTQAENVFAEALAQVRAM